MPLAAAQDERARTEALTARATARLEALHREAERLASESRTLLGDLRKFEVERQIKTEELRQLDAESRAISADLDDLNRDAEELQRIQAAEEPEVRARLVELYKLGQASYVRLLLSTSDGRNLAQASRMVAAVAKRDRDRLDAHLRRRQEIDATRASLEQRHARLDAVRAETERARQAADRALNQRNALIRDIDRQRDLNARLAGELLSAQQKLQGTLRDLAAGSGSTEAAALPLAPFQGELPWPVSSASLQRPRSTANGVQLTAQEGTPVQAVHDGTVS
jgi:septal ring factor EnvC (AmiA/AmiB activator)